MKLSCLFPSRYSVITSPTVFSLQQQGTYYTQPLYAAPPHVIHHTTVVQPNGMPATMYPAPIPPPRGNGVTMGMVAGTTMAMSAGGCPHSPGHGGTAMAVSAGGCPQSHGLFSVGGSLLKGFSPLSPREHNCVIKWGATGALWQNHTNVRSEGLMQVVGLSESS